MEVYPACDFCFTTTLMNREYVAHFRPKDHHVFDVLHWIKAAFKKHALDEIKEIDCLNKEAFRLYARLPSFSLASTSF